MGLPKHEFDLRYLGIPLQQFESIWPLSLLGSQWWLEEICTCKYICTNKDTIPSTDYILCQVQTLFV